MRGRGEVRVMHVRGRGRFRLDHVREYILFLSLVFLRNRNRNFVRILPTVYIIAIARAIAIVIAVIPI